MSKGLYQSKTILRQYTDKMKRFLKSQSKYIRVNRIMDAFLAMFPNFCKNGGWYVKKYHITELVRKLCVPYSETKRKWAMVYVNPYYVFVPMCAK